MGSVGIKTPGFLMAGQEAEMRATVRPSAEVVEGLSRDGEPEAVGDDLEEAVFGAEANEEDDREVAEALAEEAGGC